MASRALVAPLAVAILILLAPAASAQVTVPDPTAVLDDVGATAGSTAEETVGTVTGTVTDTVNDTVADPTGVLPDEVEETVDSITEPAQDPVKKVLTAVDQAVPGVVGTIPDEVLGEDQNNGTGLNGSGSLRPGSKGRHGTADRIRGAGTAGDETLFGGVDLATEDRALTAAITVTMAPEPSLFSQALEIAVKGLLSVAFPLLLAALVAAFLALHGRVGRKDPKLAAAPLDPRQTSLTFR